MLNLNITIMKTNVIQKFLGSYRYKNIKVFSKLIFSTKNSLLQILYIHLCGTLTMQYCEWWKTLTVLVICAGHLASCPMPGMVPPEASISMARCSSGISPKVKGTMMSARSMKTVFVRCWDTATDSRSWNLRKQMRDCTGMATSRLEGKKIVKCLINRTCHCGWYCSLTMSNNNIER